MTTTFLIKTGVLGAALSLMTASVGTAVAQTSTFIDTRGHWAESYVSALANAGVIGGFPDGSFRPDQAVTRAQFATIINNAFQLSGGASYTSNFRDVPSSYWAASAINSAASSRLVAGFPDGTFRPDQNVTRAQSLVVMTNALGEAGVPVSNTYNVLSRYRDANAVPDWAANALATATEANLVVNFPDPNFLEPNRSATRAEVAAFTYQTLARQGRLGPIAQNPQNQNPQFQPPQTLNPQSQFDLQVSSGVRAGSIMPVANLRDERLYIAPNETRPLSLVIYEPIRNDQGAVVVPYGSRVDGRFEPAPGGSRFVAESVIIDNQVYPLSAQTDVLNDIKDPRHTSTGQVVQDAAIGAAASAVLSGITGNRVISTERVLAGGAAGAAIGNFTAPRVVVLDPQQPIQLRLTQDFSTIR